MVHRAVVAAIGEVAVEQGKQGFGYWCVRFPDFENCGTSMSEEHSWTPADQLIAYDHCR